MRFAAAFALAFTLSPAALAQDTPSVTIPLTQYEQMRKTADNVSATVVDTLTIGGTFAAKNLTMTFSGRNVGARTPTEVLTNAPELTLSGCSGAALLMRGGKGAYQIVALAPSFTLRCDARISGSDRLRVEVPEAVLAVRSAVTDGELVSGDDSGDTRSYTLVRQVAGRDGETLATTATGRYLITLLPDATRFRYVIQVHNPNRSTSPLPLHLVSGEHLQQIDSTAQYEPKDGSYIFAMPPGDSTIMLIGELQGTSFAPPVEASLQYLVLESHPLLRPALQSQPKRVSVGEAAMTAQYRGALAFEIGPRERIAWTVTKLEALRTISYAVRFTGHTLFIPARGPVLGESQLTLDNQGAPELVLPQHPQPTYVSLGNEPVLMTKNAAGQLTVPLSAGQQNVLVQHQQNVPRWPIFAAQLELPRLAVPATDTYVQLRYPEQWLPLWQSFGSRTRLWRPETETVVLFIVLAVWIDRVLLFFGMRRGRMAVALLLAYAAQLLPIVLWAVAIGFGLLTALWLAAIRSRVSIAGVAVIAMLGLIAAITLIAYSGRSRESEYTSTGTGGIGAVSAAVTDTAVFRVPAAMQNAPAPPPPTTKVDALSYQGLPAKFELPNGAYWYNFHEQMLAVDHPHTVAVAAVATSLLVWLAVGMALTAAFLLWRERELLAAAVRTRLAEATPVPEAPVPA